MFAGIVPDDLDALTGTLRAALAGCDVLVVSAGSSVGARDATAAAVAALGEPGIWCHGLALRPGKPTLLAECEGVPVIGLPGNPRSALVVFRLVGMPIVREVGGWTEGAVEPSVRARLARDLPSAAGRLDIVQVALAGGEAVPLFGSSSLLSVLTAADGYLVVPEAATGLAAGSEVEVSSIYRRLVTRSAPFIHDIPAAEALAAWVEACAAAGLSRAPRGRSRCRSSRPWAGSPPSPVWATRSSPPFDAAAMDGIAVRAGDRRASETSPVRLEPAAYEVVDTGDPMPDGRDAVVMREDVHERDGGATWSCARPFLPARALDRRGRERGRAAAAGRPPPAAGRRGGRGGGGGGAARGAPPPGGGGDPDGDEIRPVGAELGPGELPDTNSLMLAAQAEEAGCEVVRHGRAGRAGADRGRRARGGRRRGPS